MTKDGSWCSIDTKQKKKHRQPAKKSPYTLSATCEREHTEMKPKGKKQDKIRAQRD